jgi:hypothetical protein
MTVRRVLGEARGAATIGVVRLGIGWRLRAAIVAGMVLAVGASFGAGGTVPWIVPTLLVAAAMVAAARPDTHVGLGVLLAFGWYWLANVGADASPWTVVAAAGLLVFHLGTSAAALGPAEVELPPSLLVAWARRCVPILGGTVALWLLTAGLTSFDASSNVVLTAAALVVVAVGGWVALSRSKPESPSPGSTP